MDGRRLGRDGFPWETWERGLLDSHYLLVGPSFIGRALGRSGEAVRKEWSRLVKKQVVRSRGCEDYQREVMDIARQHADIYKNLTRAPRIE